MVRELEVLPPDFTPGSLEFPSIPVFTYARSAQDEIDDGHLDQKSCLNLLEQMLTVRAFEEMILALRSQAYGALKDLDFEYRGPTHVSIGQEATSVGACAAGTPTDYITSTHRGHGDGIAKGCTAIHRASDEQLKTRLGLPDDQKLSRDELEELALEDHVFRTAAELFGREAGYCKGRGGGMHIADFSVSHLGANAIVGGSIGIATGAGYSARYRRSGQVVLCFAGDGAYSNGIAFESMNMAAMAQFTNELAKEPFGVPTVYLIVNNQYGMTGQQQGEVTGVDYLARRAAAFNMDCMHAEVANGMDVLAVFDSVRRGIELARQGEGPVVRELITYRYQGHSLSDPRNEYRSREEESAWRAQDCIEGYKGKLIEAGLLTEEQFDALKAKVEQRQERAAVRAVEAPEPDVREVTRYIFTEKDQSDVPPAFANPPVLTPIEKTKRVDGQITYKEALREAMVEEMARDGRVIFYGEDVADYGGAFKVTKGLIDMFGRDRVFNTSISEAAIIGTGVGAAMTELRPIVELMYSDFEFQAGDQIHNQAAKWSYMSGGMTSVPMVIRTSAGAGKGYGGQHSQSLESHSTHTPGLKVVVPSTPYDVKGLMKSSIRDNDPVVFVESQALYNDKGDVPEEEYVIPLGVADIKREGKDATVIAWSYLVGEALKAAEELSKEGIEIEVVDPRTLIPLDLATLAESVKKTGRAVVASQAVRTGSYTGEVLAQLQEEVFDYLDAPILRVGALDAVSPQSQALEEAYLPNANSIVAAVRKVCA